MSDYDRGAYAPEHDAPLAFDPRQMRGGGPAPFSLILSLIVLLALAGGGYMVYRHGVRRADTAPQLVGAPVGQTRTAPSGEPQPADASAGLQVYKTEVPPAAESPPSFAPPPEQPQPLPAARPEAPITASPLRPTETAAPPPASKPAKPAPVAAKPAPAAVQVASTKPAPPHVAAPPPASQAVASEDSSWVAGSAFANHGAPPARTAAQAAKTPPPAVAASGSVLVQIGAFADSAQADKSWGDLARAMPSQMAGKSRKVETVTKDGKTLFRAYVGGFASSASAASFCATLRAAGKACFVK